MIKLSITGADDLVSIEHLKSMVQKYPLLELAILYFPEKEGHPRNPSSEWRKKLYENIPKENIALHLCGFECFNNILKDNFLSTELYHELTQVSRLQLNINARQDIFTIDEIHSIYSKLIQENFNLIFQYNDRSKEWILPFIKLNIKKKINILLDSSLGKGIPIKDTTIPVELEKFNFPLGFAGSINPENIIQIHQEVQKNNLPNYWLDLESGARTNNQFDILKFIDLCHKFFH